MVARIANAGIFPAWDSIHSVKAPSGGNFILADYDLALPQLPEMVAMEAFEHLKHIGISGEGAEAEKRRLALFLHDQLADDKAKATFRQRMLAEFILASKMAPKK